mmetsp:Transcript_4323/g.10424  ORF Transcript_4323/g.10424 Transcript_4323/m.10424 type:complete len:95 (+) Transcript_4323:1223-1507(+)
MVGHTVQTIDVSGCMEFIAPANFGFAFQDGTASTASCSCFHDVAILSEAELVCLKQFLACNSVDAIMTAHGLEFSSLGTQGAETPKRMPRFHCC